MTYFVNEIQNGTITGYSYNDRAAAQSKYFDILRYAALSDVAIHGAMCFDNYGNNIEQPRVFMHSATVDQ